jgi:hypothetical protein
VHHTLSGGSNLNDPRTLHPRPDALKNILEILQLLQCSPSTCKQQQWNTGDMEFMSSDDNEENQRVNHVFQGGSHLRVSYQVTKSSLTEYRKPGPGGIFGRGLSGPTSSPNKSLLSHRPSLMPGNPSSMPAPAGEVRSLEGQLMGHLHDP